MKSTFFIAASLITGGLIAQSALTKPAPARSTETSQMRLNVEVQNPDGTPVNLASAQGLQLLNDGIVQPGAVFDRERGAGTTRVVLLIDDVNVPYMGVASERERLGSYLKHKSGPLPLQTSIGFIRDTGVQVLPHFTTDRALLLASLKHANIPLREITRSAGFYGATERLQSSLKGLGLLLNDASHTQQRTLLVWLSAGWPLLSGPGVQLEERQQMDLFRTIVQLNTEMRLANVTLYDVDAWGPQESVLRATYYENFLKGVKTPRDVEIGDLGLQVLAVQSGGFAAPPSNDIGKALDHVYADGSEFYTVRFTRAPGEDANQYHSLSVRSTSGTARTTTGYYANARWPEQDASAER